MYFKEDLEMSVSMYRISVPVFRQSLAALFAVLEKAETFCSENDLESVELLEKRLAPDMFTLKQQVQRATFHAAQAAAKLTSSEIPLFEDNENSFRDLKTRVQKVVEILGGFNPDQFEGSEGKELEVLTRIGTIPFIGEDFLLHFAIPQFFFHVTTAYDIIRSAGVQLEKRDFIGSANYR